MTTLFNRSAQPAATPAAARLRALGWLGVSQMNHPTATAGGPSFSAVLAAQRSAAPHPPAAAPMDIDGLIRQAARRYGVDERLVRAVVRAESNFNPRAVSRAGAKGLMQLMDATARRYGVQDPFDPAQNLEAGVRYLHGLLHQFHGDVRLALAAYNAGPAAVQHYDGVPPYHETRAYVSKMMAELRAHP